MASALSPDKSLQCVFKSSDGTPRQRETQRLHGRSVVVNGLTEIPCTTDETRERKVHWHTATDGGGHRPRHRHVSRARGARLPRKERKVRAGTDGVEPMHVNGVCTCGWVRERHHLVRVAVSGLTHAGASPVDVHVEVGPRRCDEPFVDPDPEEHQPGRHDNVLMDSSSRIRRQKMETCSLQPYAIADVKRRYELRGSRKIIPLNGSALGSVRL